MYFSFNIKGAHKYLSPKKGAEDPKEVKIVKNKMIRTHQMMNIWRQKTRTIKKKEEEDVQKVRRIRKKQSVMRF